jgi:hypothetical protein
MECSSASPPRHGPAGPPRGLKAERGSFSYALAADVAAATVLIWCDRYAVPIAAADLSPA